MCGLVERNATTTEPALQGVKGSVVGRSSPETGITKAAWRQDASAITKEINMQQQINALAKSCGVDPLTIEQAAHAVCRRLIEWHGDGPIDASQDIIETALLDHVETNKRMSIRAHMNQQQFARQVLGRIKQGNQHDH